MKFKTFKLSVAQRSFAADKLIDTANYAVAGLVFGQLLTPTFQPILLVGGLVIYFLGWIIALYLRRKG